MASPTAKRFAFSKCTLITTWLCPCCIDYHCNLKQALWQSTNKSILSKYESMTYKSTNYAKYTLKVQKYTFEVQNHRSLYIVQRPYSILLLGENTCLRIWAYLLRFDVEVTVFFPLSVCRFARFVSGVLKRQYEDSGRSQNGWSIPWQVIA